MVHRDKAKVAAICVAGVLLLILGIIMICGGCSDRSDPEWNFLWKPQTTDGSTDSVGATTDNTNTTTNETTGTSEGTTTAPTQGQSGGSQGTNNNHTKPSTNPPTRPTIPIPPEPTSAATSTETTPTEPTSATTSTETTPSESTDAATSTEITVPETEERLLSYEEWDGLRVEEKKAYRDSFPIDGVSYNDWYTAAKQEYDSTFPTTDGNIDLGGGK